MYEQTNEIMKKLLFALFAVALGVIPAMQAQELEVVQESDVPQAVLDSFKKDFPDVKAKGWQILPQSELAEHEDYLMELAMGDYESPSEEPHDIYTVSFYGKGIAASATYDQVGKLIASKEKIKDTALPSAVATSVVSKYPGWKIVGDREVIKNLDHEVYKVRVEKGKEKQWLYFDGKGNAVEKRLSTN